MSDATRTTRRWRFWQQVPLLIALVVLWMLLWGEVTLLSALSGVAVAIGVTRVFYLPPVELSGRIHIGWTIVFIARFARDVVVSSVVVAAHAFRPRSLPQNAIIQVQLRTRSDFVMSVIAIVVSLVPGTLVLEIDRERAILFLHILGAGDMATVERNRRAALALERLVVRAIGSRADLERIRS